MDFFADRKKVKFLMSDTASDFVRTLESEFPELIDKEYELLRCPKSEKGVSRHLILLPPHCDHPATIKLTLRKSALYVRLVCILHVLFHIIILFNVNPYIRSY